MVVKDSNKNSYGEAWLMWKMQFLDKDMDFEKEKPMNSFNHRKRMVGKSGIEYYKEKINKEFKRLGYIKELKVSDFESVEDYFGYFEAQRFKEKLVA